MGRWKFRVGRAGTRKTQAWGGRGDPEERGPHFHAGEIFVGEKKEPRREPQPTNRKKSIGEVTKVWLKKGGHTHLIHLNPGARKDLKWV